MSIATFLQNQEVERFVFDTIGRIPRLGPIIIALSNNPAGRVAIVGSLGGIFGFATAAIPGCASGFRRGYYDALRYNDQLVDRNNAPNRSDVCLLFQSFNNAGFVAGQELWGMKVSFRPTGRDLGNGKYRGRISVNIWGGGIPQDVNHDADDIQIINEGLPDAHTTLIGFEYPNQNLRYQTILDHARRSGNRNYKYDAIHGGDASNGMIFCLDILNQIGFPCPNFQHGEMCIPQMVAHRFLYPLVEQYDELRDFVTRQNVVDFMNGKSVVLSIVQEDGVIAGDRVREVDSIVSQLNSAKNELLVHCLPKLLEGGDRFSFVKVSANRNWHLLFLRQLAN